MPLHRGISNPNLLNFHLKRPEGLGYLELRENEVFECCCRCAPPLDHVGAIDRVGCGRVCVNLVRASARSQRVHSRGRANLCRIDNFNLLPVAQSPIARTTRGSSSSWCPAKRMYNPPTPSTATASVSTKSSRMMARMWCRHSARAFPLMAIYGLSCGMLPTTAAIAFSMVFVTNGTIGTAGIAC